MNSNEESEGEMAQDESREGAEDRDGEDQEVGSAAPSEERKVVGENADTPEGKGEEADEVGVDGGQDDDSTPSEPSAEDDESAKGVGSDEDRDDAGHANSDDADERDDEKDDRDPLAKEIESDPASNPDDPVLGEIRGG